MSIFEVFRRKKKEEEELPVLDVGMAGGGMHERPEIDFAPDLGPMPKEDDRPTFTNIHPMQTGISDKDIQLILAKLELINRKLDDMDNRLMFIEKIAKESK